MAETSVTDLAVYSAKPTVRIAGKEDERMTELVIGLEMREHEGGLSALELRLSNVASLPEGDADVAFEDEKIIKLGTQISIYGGDERSPQEIFSGLITGFEAEFPADSPPELVVFAEDGLQAARMARRTAFHKGLSLASLAKEIAGRLGLTPKITGLSDSLGDWVQLNESDLAFLRRLLRRHDADLQVVGKELHVSARADVKRGTLDLELHSQLRQARATVDLADQMTATTISGWDAVAGSRVSATSTGSQGGPGKGRTGAQVLRDTLGARSEHLGHLAPTTQDEAQALADAAFDRRARRFVRVEGTSEGNPALRVGTHVNIKGLSLRFDNTYYVVSACHRFDVKRGYETDFEAECAFLGAAG
jgi:phage protein D